MLTIILAAGADLTVRDSDELRAALARPRQGMVISLAPGTYDPNVVIRGARDLVLQGEDPKDPPVFEGGRQALHLVGCRDVTLRNITVKGCSANGINIDDGGSCGVPARGILLERITILDTGPRGNVDGLKLSGVDDFRIKDCRIAGWGGSAIDMVGCHEGIIEDCRIQGKEGFSQSSGVQMKGGSRKIIVRGCLFENAGQRAINLGGSTGLAYFRPEDARFEAEAITVTGCRIRGSLSPIAFVNSRRGHVHHNTIVMPDKWVMRILQESTGERFPPCQKGIFESNLIVFDGRVRTFVNVGPGTDPDSFIVRKNAWFQTDGNTRPRLPVPEEDGVYQVDPKLVEMEITSRDPRLKGIGARASQEIRLAR
jgi:hypothetical protein